MPVQNEIELILIRRWASYVMLPLFVAGADGRLLYFNDAAAVLLGRPFDVAGEMQVSDLDDIFQTATEAGVPVPADELPIQIALTARRPAQRRFRIRALDGQLHVIDVFALPLEGQGGRFLGALAAFWEVEDA